jgi:hypothetical protein
VTSVDSIITAISAFSGLTCEGQSNTAHSVIPPLEAWKKVASFNSRPFGSVKIESEKSQLINWFSSALQAEKMSSRIYISIGGYGRLPWIQLELSTGFDALADFWLSTDTHEILILNAAMDCILGVTEEEYDYEIYKIVLSARPPIQADEDTNPGRWG